MKFCVLVWVSLFFKTRSLVLLRNMKMRARAGCTDRYLSDPVPVNNQKKKTQNTENKKSHRLLGRSGGCFLSRQNEPPLFSKDGHKFFFTRAIPQGGRGKFFHISMSSFLVKACRSSQPSRLPSGLTSGSIPAQHEHGHPPVPDLGRLGCHQNPGLQPRKEPHVRPFQGFYCIVKALHCRFSTF